jgi:hypothetical protein
MGTGPVRRVGVVLALALAAAASAVACQSSPDDGGQMRATEARKSGTGELRSDTEPLTTRFPVLSGPLDARWMSGTYGGADSPGPSTYWIDAVVTLGRDQVDTLRSTYGPTASGGVPAVVDGLKEQLPPGPFLTSDALDKAFNHERWWASAYLDPEAGKLVIVATGT